MKAYNLSGGATRIGGLFAKSERIIKEFGYKPNIITGVSSGALLALPIALGKWDELKKLISNFNLDDIFDSKPVNKKGNITLKGVYRAAIGEPSLGTQNNLRYLLASLVTELDFYKYTNSNCPKVYVGVVNMNTGLFELVDVSLLNYEQYLDYTIASTSIPIAVEGVEINGEIYFDGGLIHHTCTKALIDKYKSKLTHCITVFSRPKVIDTSYENFDQIDISQVAKAVYDLNISYISIKDQEIEKALCGQYNIKNIQVFCPKVLESLYDVDPSRLKELYERSYRNEEKIFYRDFI